MEFVSWSSFWSLNHVLPSNGAEAALAFPCLNTCLLVLFNASICSKKARNQICRMLEMQLTLQQGTVQRRYLFLPALMPFKPVGLSALQKALLLAHQPSSLLQSHRERLPSMAGTEWLFRIHLSNTQGLQHVSVSPRTEDGVWFFSLSWEVWSNPRAALMFSFLFWIKLAKNYYCLSVAR